MEAKLIDSAGRIERFHIRKNPGIVASVRKFTGQKRPSALLSLLFSSRCKMIKSAILSSLPPTQSYLCCPEKYSQRTGYHRRGNDERKDKVSWAVRRGLRVMVDSFFYIRLQKTQISFRPVLRAINLLESLSLGYSTLSLLKSQNKHRRIKTAELRETRFSKKSIPGSASL